MPASPNVGKYVFPFKHFPGIPPEDSRRIRRNFEALINIPISKPLFMVASQSTSSAAAIARADLVVPGLPGGDDGALIIAFIADNRRYSTFVFAEGQYWWNTYQQPWGVRFIGAPTATTSGQCTQFIFGGDATSAYQTSFMGPGSTIPGVIMMDLTPGLIHMQDIAMHLVATNLTTLKACLFFTGAVGSRDVQLENIKFTTGTASGWAYLLRTNAGLRAQYMRCRNIYNESGGTMHLIAPISAGLDTSFFENLVNMDSDQTLLGSHSVLIDANPTSSVPLGSNVVLPGPGAVGGLTNSHIFVGNASAIATDVAMSGDATIVASGAVTLKNTGPGATGPIGDATHVPVATIDAQGRVTALSSVPISSSTSQGLPGADGEDGLDGFPGPPGVPGAAGPQGAAGIGARGQAGEDGDDALDGFPGPPGPPGATGPQGPQGRQGMDGLDGDDGIDGRAGPPGNTTRTVCTSSTHPAAPLVGDEIFEADTGKTLYWVGATDGWQRDWGVAWGFIGEGHATSNQTTITTTTDITGLTVTFTAIANRRYKVSLLNMNLQSTVGTDTYGVFITDTSNTVLQEAFGAFSGVNIQAIVTMGLYTVTPSTAGSYTFKVRAGRNSGTGSLQSNASAAQILQILVEDDGPNGNPV